MATTTSAATSTTSTNQLSPDKVQQLLAAKKEYETREAAGAGAQELMAIHARANDIRSQMGVAKNDSTYGETSMASDVAKTVKTDTGTTTTPTPTPAPAAPTPSTSAPSTFTPPSTPAMSYGQAVGQVSNQVDPLYLRALENVRRQRSQDQLDTEQIAVARGGQHSGLAADAQTKVFNNAATNMSNIEADRQKQIADLAQMLMNRSEDNQYRDRVQALQEWLGNQNVGMQRDQFNYQTGRDQVGDSRWNQQFQYQQGRDTVGDNQWQQQFGYQQGRDQVGDSQWSQQFNFQKAQQDWENTFKQGQFDQQKASDLWERTFKEKNFDQSVKQFASSMGLDYSRLNQDQQQFVAQQAYRDKALGWDMSPDNPSNQPKPSPSPGPSKNDVESSYIGNIERIDPTRRKEFFKNEKENITKDLGISGYNTLYNTYFDAKGNPK